MHRRAFLSAAAAGVSTAALAAAPVTTGDDAGMIVRESEPQNLEFPFSTLRDWQTPTSRHFVRSHFAVPKLDASAWRLRVDGAVDRPLEISLGDLQRLPSATMPLTMECAGNGRVFLTPKVRGVAWQLGAVGNAVWTGVPLAEILSRAGVRKSAVEIVLEGADRGAVNDDPKSPGPITFARSLPIVKAMKPEVLLAYSMNAGPLPLEHGAPLRAVVGGWYGMASVKWLARIVAVEAPFAGFWQTMDYSYFRRVDGLPALASIGEMQVKSAIARPAIGEIVPRDAEYRIFGAAWAGEAAIARVDVSTDGGASWSPAALVDRAAPFCWRFWEYRWRTPSSPGRARLLARATDDRGRVQPMERNPDLRTYLIHHVVPVDVTIG